MAVGPGGHEALLKLACLQLNPKDERNTGVNRILDGWWLRMGVHEPPASEDAYTRPERPESRSISQKQESLKTKQEM